MTKPYTSLIPSIDARLTTWAGIQERMALPGKVHPRPTITLSRQFGCEAFPLAQRLETLMAEITGEAWVIYDKALIDRVAEAEGIRPRILEHLGDRSRALEALGFMPAGHTTHDEAFEKVARLLVQVGRVGHAIIVGRGGAVLCQGLKNAFHFRLEAGFDFRVASIMRRQEMSQTEAERFVKENARLRDRFISECLGVDVNDLRYYDAVFNNEHHTIQEIAAAIAAYIQTAWKAQGLAGG